MRVLIIAILMAGMWLQLTTPAQASVANWKKSATINPKSIDDYGSDNFRTTVVRVKGNSFNWITLVVPLYQDNIYASDIYRGWNTPTDESLKSAINFIHSQQMGVTVKMHLEPNDGQWRALLQPANRDKWFGSWSYWLNYFGTLGKAAGAEEMIIGAELYNMTSPKVNGNNTAKWKTMIGSLRQTFSGDLGYSAQREENAYNEVGEIEFWGDLNHIGVSAYYPLATWTYNPSVAEIVSSWEGIGSKYFQPLASRYQKPIELTEIGYRSVNGNHYHPYDWSSNDGVNLNEQANLYEGLFQYWNTQNYLTGVHLWEWSTNPNDGGNWDSNYTPQNKPAETVIAGWFSKTDSSPLPTASPTPEANGTWAVTGSAGPNPGGINQNITITITVESSTSVSNKIIDAEIYDPGGNRVYQQFWESTDITAGVPRAFSFNWQNNIPGNYRLAVGIFNTGWNGLNLWTDEVAIINIGQNNQVPTGTPIQTPTVTPTPLPTASPTLTPTSMPTPAPTGLPTSIPTPAPTTAPQPTEIYIWWPTDGANLSGIQPVKAMVSNMDLLGYKMWWQVDEGGQNDMTDSQTDYPHKENLIDVSGWSWKGNGPYRITVGATQNDGRSLGQKTVDIYVSR